MQAEPEPAAGSSPAAGGGECEWGITRAEFEDFARCWAESASKPLKTRLLTPLPRRTRLRLWATSLVDRAGGWLVGHGHVKAARILWRI